MVDQRQAIEALLARSGRNFLPLRRALVQRRDERGGGGPVAAFTKRESALDLYLLLHALAAAEPWDVVLASRVWARLVGDVDPDERSLTFLSRQWRWLEDQGLVRLERAGRNRRVTLLREDGSGKPYAHPGLGTSRESPEGDYFRLPYSYWQGAFDQRLRVPGKTVLLIALSLQDDFILPVEHGAKWYGVSPERVQRGLKELLGFNVLTVKTQRREAPLTERGFTFDRRYTLRAPFRDLDDARVR